MGREREGSGRRKTAATKTRRRILEWYFTDVEGGTFHHALIVETQFVASASGVDVSLRRESPGQVVLWTEAALPGVSDVQVRAEAVADSPPLGEDEAGTAPVWEDTESPAPPAEGE